MNDTKIKWTKQPVYPSLYTATIGGRDYEAAQRFDETRIGMTTWTARCTSNGAPLLKSGTFASAKAACERHAKGAAT